MTTIAKTNPDRSEWIKVVIEHSKFTLILSFIYFSYLNYNHHIFVFSKGVAMLGGIFDYLKKHWYFSPPPNKHNSAFAL